jgi:hypothetical protein
MPNPACPQAATSTETSPGDRGEQHGIKVPFRAFQWRLTVTRGCIAEGLPGMEERCDAGA